MSTECTLCVFVSMQFDSEWLSHSFEPFLWAISSHFQILMNRKILLYTPTHCCSSHCCQKNFFIFVMQAKIEYKRHKKRRAEKNGICNFCIWQVWMPCATILADEFFFVEYSSICIHLRFILSSSDETNFKILYKYADVIHSIRVKKKLFLSLNRLINFFAKWFSYFIYTSIPV